MLVLQILKWDTSSIIAHDFLHVLAFHLPLDESKRSVMLRHAQTLVTMCIIGEFYVAFKVTAEAVTSCQMLQFPLSIGVHMFS